MLEGLVVQADAVEDVLRCDIGVVVHLRRVSTRDGRVRSIRCAR